MPLGDRGSIGIKKETTWGERVVGVNDVFLPFVSEGLTRDVEEIIAAAHRAILDEPISYQGQKSFGGPIVVEAHPISLGHVCRSALGAPAAEVLAGNTETEICDCETVFEHESTHVITSLDSINRKKGTYSSKIQVSLGAVVDEVIGSRVVACDLETAPTTTHYKLWLRCDIALDAGDLALILSEQALGGDGATFDRVDIPAMAVAGRWYEHTIAISDITACDTIISAGIEMLVDKGEFTLWVDDIRIVVAGTATIAYKHVFTPMQTEASEFHVHCPLFPYTLEVFRDDSDDQAYEFLGAVVNKLGFSFSTSDKILKANMEIIAKNAGYVAETFTAIETTVPFLWRQAVIYIGGVAGGNIVSDISSFNINWDNKCAAWWACNNSYLPRKIIRTTYREIPLNFIVDFVDRTEYDHFLDGTERQMRIVFEGEAIEAGFPYTIQFDMPLVRYLTYPIINPGSGRLTVAVAGKAKYSAGYALQITLINKQRTADYAA